eukprot:snap_masked-scaffold_9-processed-gene-6.11-mRNA-1 protein AED:1.00 eAED:1.00 QI:0/-1/0/0/-1/1/1/0/363
MRKLRNQGLNDPRPLKKQKRLSFKCLEIFIVPRRSNTPEKEKFVLKFHVGSCPKLQYEIDKRSGLTRSKVHTFSSVKSKAYFYDKLQDSAQNGFTAKFIREKALFLSLFEQILRTLNDICTFSEIILHSKVKPRTFGSTYYKILLPYVKNEGSRECLTLLGNRVYGNSTDLTFLHNFNKKEPPEALVCFLNKESCWYISNSIRMQTTFPFWNIHKSIGIHLLRLTVLPMDIKISFTGINEETANKLCNLFFIICRRAKDTKFKSLSVKLTAAQKVNLQGVLWGIHKTLSSCYFDCNFSSKFKNFRVILSPPLMPHSGKRRVLCGLDSTYSEDEQILEVISHHQAWDKNWDIILKYKGNEGDRD